MIKIKRASQIHGKKEGVKILEDKLCTSKDRMNQSKLDQWLNEVETGVIGEWSVQDTGKWDEFKDRYKDEFEDKIELLDKIMAKKKERVKVTWISIINILKVTPKIKDKLINKQIFKSMNYDEFYFYS